MLVAIIYGPDMDVSNENDERADLMRDSKEKLLERVVHLKMRMTLAIWDTYHYVKVLTSGGRYPKCSQQLCRVLHDFGQEQSWHVGANHYWIWPAFLVLSPSSSVVTISTGFWTIEITQSRKGFVWCCTESYTPSPLIKMHLKNIQRR